ncbi:YfiR family protein [bacterium]|nr:YfiR family protein [bacterium]MBU1884763.1 YfiR family protein [bacterium]
MRQILLIILLTAGFMLKLSAAPLPEDTIKVAYIYNFALLTEWPKNKEIKDIHICFYERSNFGTALDALKDKSIEDHSLKIQNISNINEAKECQVLFLDDVNFLEEEKIAKAVSDLPILVVTDNPNISDSHIMIIRENKKLAFDISLRKLKDTNLSISSRLLRLARRVTK